jgi:hypothetical protein
MLIRHLEYLCNNNNNKKENLSPIQKLEFTTMRIQYLSMGMWVSKLQECYRRKAKTLLRWWSVLIQMGDCTTALVNYDAQQVDDWDDNSFVTPKKRILKVHHVQSSTSISDLLLILTLLEKFVARPWPRHWQPNQSTTTHVKGSLWATSVYWISGSQVSNRKSTEDRKSCSGGFDITIQNTKKIVLVLYSDIYREILDQYRFKSWQATDKNDALSSAHCGLRQVSSIAPSPAASQATRPLCSCKRMLNPSQSWN